MSARALAEQRCKEALECCDNDAHRVVIIAAFAAVRAESAARIAQLEKELQEARELYEANHG